MENCKQLPKHIGIIMDGNGRWAKERGLPRSLGHQEGAKNLKKLLYHMYERGIQYVSLYAFSTENFERNQKEVDFLMDLFVTLFHKELKSLKELGVKVVFSGRKAPLKEKVWNAMMELVDATKEGQKGVLNICLNYGGQYEIVDMVQKIARQVQEKQLKIEEITKEVVEQNLYQQLPPLDFVIRTSGERRTSNFMIYQAAYAEYYFPNIYFPDFQDSDFDEAILDFQNRSRRFGKNEADSRQAE